MEATANRDGGQAGYDHNAHAHAGESHMTLS
jgi:hypothetical protein